MLKTCVAAVFHCIYLHLNPFFSPPDLGRDPLITGKQAVEIKHTLKEPRSLADPVRTTGHTKELHLRDACWRQANGEMGEHFSFFFFFFVFIYVTAGDRICANMLYFPLKQNKLTCGHVAVFNKLHKP